MASMIRSFPCPLCCDRPRFSTLLRRCPTLGNAGGCCILCPRALATLNDVINGLDAELFKTCFANWVEALRDRAPDIIAIDGKTSRRSHGRRKGREPLHLVSAWAARQRLVLGQQAVDDKSNEIVAIPLLLERLELAGALSHRRQRPAGRTRHRPRQPHRGQVPPRRTG